MTSRTANPTQSLLALLEQGLSFIVKLPDDIYAAHMPPFESPIGAHFRHILDHIHVVATGLKTGVIDYTARRRDPEIETDRHAGLTELTAQISTIRGLDIPIFDGPVMVEDEGFSGRISAPSSIAREFQFLESHTIHHFSMIGSIARLGGISVPAAFGRAPSTIRFRASQNVHH